LFADLYLALFENLVDDMGFGNFLRLLVVNGFSTVVMRLCVYVSLMLKLLEIVIFENTVCVILMLMTFFFFFFVNFSQLKKASMN